MLYCITAPLMGQNIHEFNNMFLHQVRPLGLNLWKYCRKEGVHACPWPARFKCAVIKKRACTRTSKTFRVLLKQTGSGRFFACFKNKKGWFLFHCDNHERVLPRRIRSCIQSAAPMLRGIKKHMERTKESIKFDGLEE